MDYSKTQNIDPSHFTSDKQGDLYSYWQKIRGDRVMPCRHDLDPADIPHLLSAIWLADVVREDQIYFKVRLFGTKLVQAFQLEGTHLRLDSVSFSGDIIERLNNLVITKNPYFYVCDFPVESPDFRKYSTLTLPMSSNDDTVDVIISYVHCY